VAVLADPVQLDPVGSSGQHAVDVRGGATVPHQDDCGHAYSLGTPPARAAAAEMPLADSPGDWH
jgi:hypothetical protein